MVEKLKRLSIRYGPKTDPTFDPAFECGKIGFVVHQRNHDAKAQGFLALK